MILTSKIRDVSGRNAFCGLLKNPHAAADLRSMHYYSDLFGVIALATATSAYPAQRCAADLVLCYVVLLAKYYCSGIGTLP